MGLISRITEEAGVCTTTITSARDITAAVKPPRSLFVDFPLGHQAGRPFEPKLQRSIVVAALRLLDEVTVGGTIKDFPYQWPDGDAWRKNLFHYLDA